MADDLKSYTDKIKLWGLYVLAAIVLAIASALANRWLGKDVVLPPPPVIVVTPDADGFPNVQVLDTKGTQ